MKRIFDTDADAALAARIETAETSIAAVRTTADAAAPKTDVTAVTTRVGTAEKAIADNKTATDKAVADLSAVASTNKTAADKTATDLTALATTVGNNKTAADAIKITADKAATDLATLTTTVGNNKKSQDAAIASSIADWDKDRDYVVPNKVMVGTAFFKCLKPNRGQDPTTDVSGNWGIFTPGSENDEFANRSPTAGDKRAVGIKWYDISFGSDTPLGFVSLGEGDWVFINQISLSRIRFYSNGIKNTYKSAFYGIKFFKADGTRIPDSWFVWGNGSGLGKPGAGVAFTGQQVDGDYNSSGWVEIEPSANYDYSVSIGKIMGTLTHQNCGQLQIFYSNGSVKTYTVSAYPDASTIEYTLLDATASPVPSRYGDSIGAVTLNAAKLADSTSTESGRITGSAFVSAFNQLFQAQPSIIQNYQQSVIDSLTARITELESRIP